MRERGVLFAYFRVVPHRYLASELAKGGAMDERCYKEKSVARDVVLCLFVGRVVPVGGVGIGSRDPCCVLWTFGVVGANRRGILGYGRQ